VSARKIGFLILILVFGGVVETAWHVRESHFSFGPEGFRVLGGRFYGPSFTFEESAERDLPAEAEPEIEVRNSFGGVRILPSEGDGVRIELRKVVFQPTEEKARAFADRIDLRLEEDNGRLRVGTNRDDVGRGERVGFETHLDLHVPPETVVVVRNDHGRVEASGIARAEIRSSFEDVRVEDIAGTVMIDARHGRVEAADLGAELTLKNRHGDVEVSGVAGPSEIDVQHGKLTARETAALDVKLSYGEVVAETVEGDLVLEARHAGAQVADVAGKADVRTTYEDVRLERIRGDVRAKVERGAVTVEDFQGPIEVETVGGDIVLAPRSPITDEVSASATRGGIRLEVPAGSRFELEAESRRGELVFDLPELDRPTSDEAPGGRASGRIGGGGARVKLTADDDVKVEAGSATPPAEKP
jgi:DUF4097 and DUF4098 domain-containing protein YvlB